MLVEPVQLSAEEQHDRGQTNEPDDDSDDHGGSGVPGVERLKDALGVQGKQGR